MKLGPDWECDFYDFMCYVKEHGRDKKVKQAEKFVIKDGCASDILVYAFTVKKANIKKLQRAIIQKGTLEEICSFAADVEHANIKELQKIVLEKGDAELCCNFATKVKGAKIGPLQEKVINGGSALTWYRFAANVAGANVERLQDLVLKNGNAMTYFLFAKNVKGADVKKLQDAVYATGDVKYINKFAKEVAGADKSMCIDNSAVEKMATQVFWEIIQSGVKNAAKLSYNKEKCFSKIGGNPLVPSDFIWPVDKQNKQIPFIMQLDFAELTQGEKLDDLPSEGLLYLFANEDKVNSTQSPVQGEDFQVFYLRAEKTNLIEMKPEAKPYKQHFLKAKIIKTYPGISSNEDLYKLIDVMPEAELKKYNKLCEFDAGRVMVGGNPKYFQADALEKDELQLLQLSSIDAQLMWGDYGELHLSMNKNDLQNLNFNNIKLSIETT